MLLLGFSAGLPLLLIFGSLSLWLDEAGVAIGEITYFSWAALAYSFKFVWSPLIDRLSLPVLGPLLGHRRSWLLLTQCGVIGAIVWMAHSDPANGLTLMAMAAVLLGFSSASQDIVIDALRIESAEAEKQGMLSALYVVGYRFGMLAAGVGVLYLSSWFGPDIPEGAPEIYDYAAWKWAYLCMAALMGIGVATTLFMREPEASAQRTDVVHDSRDYARFLLLFLLVTGNFVLAFVYLNPAPALKAWFLADWAWEGPVAVFVAGFARMAVAIATAAGMAMILYYSPLVPRPMVRQTYFEPVADFFRRYAWLGVTILLLILVYRISDIVLGVVANVFYKHLGFSKIEIANYSKLFGVAMTIAGGLIGGLLVTGFGVLRMLLLGAVLAAGTNLLFMLLASAGKAPMLLATVIAADSFSGGIASAAFIAYLSSLTNISFTAIQYAIFSSLMLLLPKLLGGYSGDMVATLGYSDFFLATTLMGIPSVLFVLYLYYRNTRNGARDV
ncbi:MAG TPA: MFS transporter [Gammaproteobacteria bacterium]|nr:MFS transporter [Gammaproteobacteria bacterium]